MKVEICVSDETGAEAAIRGGADRIELCAALELGGLTPSVGLLRRVRRHAAGAGVTVHAMVRPCTGDFAYDGATLALAIDEGEALVAAGADGLVFGATAGAVLDEAALASWSRHFGKRGIELTLHRAIDLVAAPDRAVDQAVALGFDRILSSGGAATAAEGAAMLRAMVERAGDRCRIAAASGVRGGNVATLIARTGVHEVHGSASVRGPEPATAVVALGFAAGAPAITSENEVRGLCEAARGAA